MKPIAQTFTITEPDTDRIFISSVDLYFAKKDALSGVGCLVQIRECGDSGAPKHGGPSVLCERRLRNSEINVNASAPTTVTNVAFEPTSLMSGSTYALVLVPDGGSDEFEVWCSRINENDVSTKNPITKNNETGSLYLSGNDVSWIPEIYEDMKFTINRCEFDTSPGQAILVSPHDEFIKISDRSISGIPDNDWVYCGNDDNIAILTITARSASFNVGETVYQNDGTSNTATGVVYSQTSTQLKVNSVTGSFNADIVYGHTSLSTATVTNIVQDTSVSSASKVITVPDASIYAANDWIYAISTTERLGQVFCLTAANTQNNTITVDNNPRFTDATAIIGTCKGGKGLGPYKSPLRGMFANYMTSLLDYPMMMLKRSNANSTVNFARSQGSRLIGYISGVYATMEQVLNLPYETLHTAFNTLEPPGTNIGYRFQGVEYGTYDQDPEPIAFQNFKDWEFNDKTRVFMSKSNQYTSTKSPDWMLISGMDSGVSLMMYCDMRSDNSKVSPVLDLQSNPINLIHNFTAKRNNRSGVYLTVETNDKPFTSFDQIYTSAGKSAYAYAANNEVISILTYDPSSWVVGDTIKDDPTTPTKTAVIKTVDPFNEALGNSPKNQSRYVSKKVDLADGYDAEDLSLYVTAYRPVGTDFLVYASIQAASDKQRMQDKVWSWMTPLHSEGLRSSLTKKNDYVELQYEFPRSTQLVNNNVTASKNSTNVQVASTSELNVGDWIYLNDSATGSFCLRKVVSITNGTTFVVNKLPNADFTYASTSMGVIPDLDHQQGAFKFMENDGKVRYIDSRGRVFDGFKTFEIKLVPISDKFHIVPRAADYRAIALQI
jgi:hypothetical protein